MTVPDRTHFESAYSGQPPWDIGRPQKTLIDVADQVIGCILDSGCGTGENALFFANRGHNVTGIDFLAEPINRAKQKATEQNVTATFLVMDALALKDWSERFDTVIDSGLFHVFNDDDRRRYVEGLAAVVKPGGHTKGHCVLLFQNRFLFTGDHLDWDRETQRLAASEDYCWYSWAKQAESMERLADFRFEWVLPGHGQKVHLHAAEMRQEIMRLASSMGARSQV